MAASVFEKHVATAYAAAKIRPQEYLARENAERKENGHNTPKRRYGNAPRRKIVAADVSEPRHTKHKTARSGFGKRRSICNPPTLPFYKIPSVLAPDLPRPSVPAPETPYRTCDSAAPHCIRFSANSPCSETTARSSVKTIGHDTLSSRHTLSGIGRPSYFHRFRKVPRRRTKLREAIYRYIRNRLLFPFSSTCRQLRTVSGILTASRSGNSDANRRCRSCCSHTVGVPEANIPVGTTRERRRNNAYTGPSAIRQISDESSQSVRFLSERHDKENRPPSSVRSDQRQTAGDLDRKHIAARILRRMRAATCHSVSSLRRSIPARRHNSVVRSAGGQLSVRKNLPSQPGQATSGNRARKTVRSFSSRPIFPDTRRPEQRPVRQNCSFTPARKLIPSAGYWL